MSAFLQHPRFHTLQAHYGCNYVCKQSIHCYSGQPNSTKHPQARRQLQLNAVSAAALDQQQVALNLPQPPEDYDYKAETLPETLDVVQKHYPQLLPLVEAGALQTQLYICLHNIRVISPRLTEAMRHTEMRLYS